MLRTSLVLPGLALLASSLSAQAFIENFNYPDGPVPPAAGWTAHSGAWAIRSGKLVQSTLALGHSYMTKNGISALNCVVELDCKWLGVGVQLGGVTARHAGLATENAMLAKIQSNSATPLGFDTGWLYERPGSVVNRTGIAPPLTDVRVRLTVLNASATMSVDTDRNGTFDMVIGPLAIATHNVAGLVGVAAGTATTGTATEMDNFAYFDAVLVPQAGTLPRIGMSYRMDLHTPATQVTPYVGIAALSAGALPLGTRAIPLAYDALFGLSLVLGGPLGLVGTTNAAGVGTPSFNIPNDPALVGLGIYVSAITLDGTQPFSVGNISNNLFFQITP